MAFCQMSLPAQFVETPTIKSPSVIGIYGGSQSGKTHLLRDLLLAENATVHIPALSSGVEKLVICYAIYQPVYTLIQEHF